MGPRRVALARITEAASAYGTIISGTRAANNGRRSSAGRCLANAGNFAGMQSVEIRNLSMPMAGWSTIGPGQSNRQSRSERSRRSKFTRCGQYVLRTFGKSTPRRPFVSRSSSAAPAMNQHRGRAWLGSDSTADATRSTSATKVWPSVTRPAQYTRTSCPSANCANVVGGVVIRSAVTTCARAATSGSSLPDERTRSDRLLPPAAACRATWLPSDPVAPMIAMEVIRYRLTNPLLSLLHDRPSWLRAAASTPWCADFRRESANFELAANVRFRPEAARSRIPQRRDERALHGPTSGAAPSHQCGESRFDAPQVGESLAHVTEPDLGKPSCLAAMRPVLQLQELGDLVKTEAEVLRRPDEVQAGQFGVAIASNAAWRPVRFGQQVLTLIEADRLDVHPRSCSEHTDRDALARRVHGVDSVLGYGSNVTP